MKRLRVGLVGAGLVGQAEHAFYLWEERDRFEFVGLADAPAAVRNALGARYGIQELHADLPSLLKATKLDALVIAAPDPFHPDLAVTALLDEAELTPKPALVDRRGSGAHHDLDLVRLRRSALSLRDGFAAISRAAMDEEPSLWLRARIGRIGRSASASPGFESEDCAHMRAPNPNSMLAHALRSL